MCNRSFDPFKTLLQVSKNASCILLFGFIVLKSISNVRDNKIIICLNFLKKYINFTYNQEKYKNWSSFLLHFFLSTSIISVARRMFTVTLMFVDIYPK
jgi:hypothetical protein